MYPFPSASYSASEGIGGARGLGNLVRPESLLTVAFVAVAGRRYTYTVCTFYLLTYFMGDD